MVRKGGAQEDFFTGFERKWCAGEAYRKRGKPVAPAWTGDSTEKNKEDAPTEWERKRNL